MLLVFPLAPHQSKGLTTAIWEMNMPDTTAVSAGAIILREIDGQLRIALAQRDTTAKPDKPWVLPKGHVEYKRGETIEEAVHREIFEETGLTSIQLIKYLGSVERASTRNNA